MAATGSSTPAMKTYSFSSATATAADHDGIAPNYVPDGELLGRLSKAVLLDAARTLGLR